MKNRSEIIKFIFYTSIFIPIIIFILEITFLFINKSSTKITNETKITKYILEISLGKEVKLI